jgi:hypothetical protein
MLVSLQIEPHLVFDAVNHWVEEKKQVTERVKKNLELDQEAKEKATLQSLVSQFIYTYLLQQISPHFKLVGKHHAANLIEKQNKNYTLLFKNATRFFKNFSMTKHPNTITWLLEILYLVSNKFKPDDSKLDKKLKSEFHEQLDILLKSAGEILTDSFCVTYTNMYGMNALSYSPTVYEMIKRFEWTKLKAPPEWKNISPTKPANNPYIGFDKSLLDSCDELPF